MLPESRRLSQLLNTDTFFGEQSGHAAIADEVQGADDDQIIAIIVKPGRDRLCPAMVTTAYENIGQQ